MQKIELHITKIESKEAMKDPIVTSLLGGNIPT